MKVIELIFESGWHFAGAFMLIWLLLYFSVNFLLKLWVKLLRAVMVSLRGWPPTHLDADGDFKSASKVDLGDVRDVM